MEKRVRKIIGIAVLAMTLAGCGKKEAEVIDISDSESVENIPVESVSVVYTDDAVNYAEKKEENEEYIGHLYFESGLIDELTVQAEDNEKYLTIDFDGNAYSSGTVFMDYRNTIYDENMIFYGHFVYADETKAFSPLHRLKEEENYEENQYLFLALEDEVRRYQVAHVYYYEMGSEDLEYFHTEYTPDELEAYLENVKEAEFYDTGIEITAGDRFVTLQTCVRDRDDLRLIVICKEVD